jgi:hypothetical protein
VAFVAIEGTPAQLSMGIIWADGPKPRVLDNFLGMKPWATD